jgi:ketosteroid isomerase-like protein
MTMADTPDVIVRYLRAAAGGDLDAVLACFSADAHVTDDNEIYQGHEEIRRWRETVTSQFVYTIDVVDTETCDNDRYVVTADLEGNFPGSPVRLKWRFAVRGGLITALEIAP